MTTFRLIMMIGWMGGLRGKTVSLCRCLHFNTRNYSFFRPAATDHTDMMRHEKAVPRIEDVQDQAYTVSRSLVSQPYKATPV